MSICKYVKFTAIVNMVFCGFSAIAQAEDVQANCVAQVTLTSDKSYTNPFVEVELDAIVTRPDGSELQVPMFWDGDDRWCLRYASGVAGEHTFRTVCSDSTNTDLHDVIGSIEISAYMGNNKLYRHGPIRVADDNRHFEHADGTPFLWLGDTWWKGLCKRITLQGFQELSSDRKAKGFNVVQIVCGPYPDEPGMMQPSWENEGGMPYLNQDFSEVNPEYFRYADRRIEDPVKRTIIGDEEAAKYMSWPNPRKGWEL